jgi:hypothetical protein
VPNMEKVQREMQFMLEFHENEVQRLQSILDPANQQRQLVERFQDQDAMDRFKEAFAEKIYKHYERSLAAAGWETVHAEYEERERMGGGMRALWGDSNSNRNSNSNGNINSNTHPEKECIGDTNSNLEKEIEYGKKEVERSGTNFEEESECIEERKSVTEQLELQPKDDDDRLLGDNISSDRVRCSRDRDRRSRSSITHSLRAVSLGSNFSGPSGGSGSYASEFRLYG